MPKVRRERTKFHAPAHKSQRQYAVPDATASLDEAAPSEPSSKTEKRKLRHEQFLNKLEQTRPTRKSKKKSKDTTQVFSMLNLLAQVTPPAPDSKPAKPDRQANTLQGGLAAHAKTPKKLTAKKQQAMANREISRFRGVLQHPEFRASPLSTIRTHVANSLHIDTASSAAN